MVLYRTGGGSQGPKGRGGGGVPRWCCPTVLCDGFFGLGGGEGRGSGVETPLQTMKVVFFVFRG